MDNSRQREIYELDDFNGQLEIDQAMLVKEIRALHIKYTKEKNLRKVFEEKSEALEKEYIYGLSGYCESAVK